MVVLYTALIEIGEFGWFDLTVTVSFVFLIGAAVEIDAVQLACCTVDAVIVVAPALVVVAAVARVVAPANVVTAFVDDGPGAVVCVEARVVGDVLGTSRPPPPQPANPAANATTETPTNRRLLANNLAPQRNP